MMGLVYKDIMVMKKQICYYLAFFVVYGFLSVTGVLPLGTILGAMVAMVGIMVPMSAMAYDEQAKWDKFAAATPVGRRGIVGGKYLLALLTIGTTGLLSSAVALVLLLTGLADGDVVEFLLSILGCALAAVFLNAVLLPIIFHFGVEKSRVLFLILFALIFGGVGLLSWAAQKSGGLHLPQLSTPLVFAVLLAAAVAALAVSYPISLGIMGRKEL